MCRDIFYFFFPHFIFKLAWVIKTLLDSSKNENMYFIAQKIKVPLYFSDKYQSQFGSLSQYAYYHEEDESSFHLVDTARIQKPPYQRGRFRQNLRNMRGRGMRGGGGQFHFQMLGKGKMQQGYVFHETKMPSFLIVFIPSFFEFILIFLHFLVFKNPLFIWTHRETNKMSKWMFFNITLSLFFLSFIVSLFSSSSFSSPLSHLPPLLRRIIPKPQWKIAYSQPSSYQSGPEQLNWISSKKQLPVVIFSENTLFISRLRKGQTANRGFRKQQGMRNNRNQAPVKNRDASVTVRADWSIIEEIDFARFSKLSLPNVKDPADLWVLI